MTVTAGVHNCKVFVQKLGALGIDVPPGLTEVLDIGADIRRAATPPDGASLDSVVAGKSRDEVAAALAEFAARSSSAAAIGERFGMFDKRLAQRFAAQLQSGDGDLLIESLRPQFTSAAQGITAALDLLGVEPDPATVLELSPAAIKAWQKLPDHRQVLDQVWELCYELHYTFGVLGQINHIRVDAPPLLMMIAPPTTNIDSVANAIHSQTGTVRAGRWLRVASVATLEIHPPSEARQTAQTIDSALAESKQRDVEASHTDRVAIG